LKEGTLTPVKMPPEAVAKACHRTLKVR